MDNIVQQAMQVRGQIHPATQAAIKYLHNLFMPQAEAASTTGGGHYIVDPYAVSQWNPWGEDPNTYGYPPTEKEVQDSVNNFHENWKMKEYDPETDIGYQNPWGNHYPSYEYIGKGATPSAIQNQEQNQNKKPADYINNVVNYNPFYDPNNKFNKGMDTATNLAISPIRALVQFLLGQSIKKQL